MKDSINASDLRKKVFDCLTLQCPEVDRDSAEACVRAVFYLISGELAGHEYGCYTTKELVACKSIKETGGSEGEMSIDRAVELLVNDQSVFGPSVTSGVFYKPHFKRKCFSNIQLEWY